MRDATSILRTVLERRRYSEADARHRRFVQPQGRAFADVRITSDGPAFRVAMPAGVTFRPGASVLTARPAGAPPGETIIAPPPVGKQGALPAVTSRGRVKAPAGPNPAGSYIAISDADENDVTWAWLYLDGDYQQTLDSHNFPAELNEGETMFVGSGQRQPIDSPDRVVLSALKFSPSVSGFVVWNVTSKTVAFVDSGQANRSSPWIWSGFVYYYVTSGSDFTLYRFPISDAPADGPHEQVAFFDASSYAPVPNFIRAAGLADDGGAGAARALLVDGIGNDGDDFQWASTSARLGPVLAKYANLNFAPLITCSGGLLWYRDKHGPTAGEKSMIFVDPNGSETVLWPAGGPPSGVFFPGEITVSPDGLQYVAFTQQGEFSPGKLLRDSVSATTTANTITVNPISSPPSSAQQPFAMLPRS